MTVRSPNRMVKSRTSMIDSIDLSIVAADARIPANHMPGSTRPHDTATVPGGW